MAYEGLIVGVLGALAGSGLGLLLVARFVPGVPADSVRATAAAGSVGAALSALAVVLPAWSTRRLRLSTLLAEE